MARHSKPRKLEQEDYDSFFEAADARPPKVTPEALIAALERKNSFRWWRLKHDYKWASKQLKRMGYDPTILKELL